jgi:hypothetical protein
MYEELERLKYWLVLLVGVCLTILIFALKFFGSRRKQFMEAYKKRLKGFVDQSELEIPGWMTISMQNYILPELYVAKEKKLDRLIFLGTHSIIQTIAEKLFDTKGPAGTQFYLENFVDGNTQDKRFSLISDDIHEMRNVMAHQWWAVSTHEIALNHEMSEGWKREPGLLHINPEVYVEQFARAFERGELIEKYCQLLTEEQRAVRKYYFIRDWLRLSTSDPIAQEIKKLDKCASMQDIRNQERLIKQMIYSVYSL